MFAGDETDISQDFVGETDQHSLAGLFALGYNWASHLPLLSILRVTIEVAF